MSEDNDLWQTIKNIYNDRTLNAKDIVRKLRNLFEIEFFTTMIEINKTELEHRKELIAKYE
ncbi:MAG: hypothetical protein ACTSRG_26975 [Candidatus Helarchaeota archaeon]